MGWECREDGSHNAPKSEPKLLPAAKNLQKDPFHHLFPQRADLAAEFSKRGVDIKRFTMQIPKDLHVEIHSGGPRGGIWNKAWEDFFRVNPNVTDIEIYQQAGKVIYEMELPGGPVVPYPR